MRRTVTLLVAGALLLSACDRGARERADDAFTNAPATPTPSFEGGEAVVTSPTPPATPAVAPAAKGAPSATCERGWVTPAPSSPDFTDPLGVIRRTAPVVGDFVMVDMRLFVGPESPPSEDKGYLRDIRRWYVKLYVDGDWTYQGRFLVEQRRFGRESPRSRRTTRTGSHRRTGAASSGTRPTPRRTPIPVCRGDGEGRATTS